MAQNVSQHRLTFWQQLLQSVVQTEQHMQQPSAQHPLDEHKPKQHPSGQHVQHPLG